MLTKRQKELLTYLAGRLTEGCCPSYEEMAEAIGLKSKSGVHRLVLGLEERGFVRRLPERARSLEVVRLPGADGPAAELTRRVAELAAGDLRDPAPYALALRALAELAAGHGVDWAAIRPDARPAARAA